MKYIKTYEFNNIKDEPQIGDYVVCNNERSIPSDDEYPIEDFIGKIIGIERSSIKVFYKIEFEDVEDWWYFYFQDILYFSSNKKDCETFITAKKYNL